MGQLMNLEPMSRLFSTSPYLQPSERGQRLFETDCLMSLPAALAPFPPFLWSMVSIIYMCFSIYMQHMPNPYGWPRARIDEPCVINT